MSPRPAGPGPTPTPAHLADPAAPAVFDDQCPTCIFRPGNPMHLRPGRLADVVAECRTRGVALVCHETSHGQAPEPVLCRGFYDRYGAAAGSVQVLYRLGGHLREVPAPPPARP